VSKDPARRRGEHAAHATHATHATHAPTEREPTRRGAVKSVAAPAEYAAVLADITAKLEAARRTTGRVVNAIMTATYWEVGRRIVEFEQGGRGRASYGTGLLKRLAADLTARFGRGFSERNVEQMRLFYLSWSSMAPPASMTNPQTPSAKSSAAAVAAVESPIAAAAGLTRPPSFPLPWSHYVRLLAVKNLEARRFYEAEALRGGWSVRQLDRQIASQFYERTALSRGKAAMLTRGARARAGERLTAEEEIKDPFVLEFLDLRDEYSESDLEEALIRQLETFLLELGGDFAFIGRQRRLRVGDTWYRVDLVFYHRRLRCLVVIDLKLGKFTHADAGQMHLYLNYAREHWTLTGENPPVGLILCAEKDSAVARYALEGLPNKVVAAEYRTTLPDEQALAAQIRKTQRALAQRGQRVRRRGKR
jgi:predicted nuclease of restriction endonuclease-like (RecB) superfamily